MSRAMEPVLAAAQVPDAPAIARDLVDFEAGESVGEQAGMRAERCDALAYLARKQANARKVAESGHDEHDFAHHAVRLLGILIDDMRGGLHEGEALVAPHGCAVLEPYPFRGHRTMAEVDALPPKAVV